MTKILGISGSLRAKSFNTYLLRAVQASTVNEVQMEAATLHGVPLYDGDEEQEHGTPEPVRALKERILASDGLILVTPEYNNGVPGVFKNAIDWLSRPTTGFTDVFKGRPVAVIGASPGGFGTILAQNHWLPVLRALGVSYWSGGRLMVSRASKVFADDGSLLDSAVRGQIEDYVEGFSAYVKATSVRQKLEN